MIYVSIMIMTGTRPAINARMRIYARVRVLYIVYMKGTQAG